MSKTRAVKKVVAGTKTPNYGYVVTGESRLVDSKMREKYKKGVLSYDEDNMAYADLVPGEAGTVFKTKSAAREGLNFAKDVGFRNANIEKFNPNKIKKTYRNDTIRDIGIAFGKDSDAVFYNQNYSTLKVIENGVESDRDFLDYTKGDLVRKKIGKVVNQLTKREPISGFYKGKPIYYKGDYK